MRNRNQLTPTLPGMFDEVVASRDVVPLPSAVDGIVRRPPSVARPHQARTLDAIRNSAMSGHKRILVVGPTGSGKMFVAAKILEAAADKGRRGAFLADQRELVQQCREELESHDVWCTTVMAGEEETLCTNVSVISKDTLWARSFRRDREEKPRADVLVMDEAHRSISKTWSAIAEHYHDAFILGFTATPCRTDGRGLGEFYDDLIIMATYKELQQQNFLVPIKLFAPTQPDLSGIKSSHGDYHKKQLECRMDREQLVGDIVKDWRQRAAGIATVAFASGVNHSIHVRNEFRRVGVRAEHLDGTTELHKRQDILGAVADGRVDVLCNYGIVTTGVDLPILKCAICARPTKSFGLWRQMCGRIQRPYAGFTEAIVLDHSSAWQRHGFPDEDVPWSLDATEKIQKRIERNSKKPRDPDDGPLQRCCEQCQCVFTGPTCPRCGWRPERVPRRVEMTPGELAEVQRVKARRETSLEDKQKYWDQCVGWAAFGSTPRTVGAASCRFRDKFGVWPNRVHGMRRRAAASHRMMLARDFYEKFVVPDKMSPH